MTLDAAIEQLVSQNLDLLAAKLEVPMAEADVLTANLRANPIFYADTQLIPYGHFSFLRPGGPPQSDININYPLDVSFKRLARTRSAREARSAVEAQLQDAVRNQIDNLYTYYVAVVQAGLDAAVCRSVSERTHQAGGRRPRALEGRKRQGGRLSGGEGQRPEGRAQRQGMRSRRRSRRIARSR